MSQFQFIKDRSAGQSVERYWWGKVLWYFMLQYVLFYYSITLNSVAASKSENTDYPRLPQLPPANWPAWNSSNRWKNTRNGKILEISFWLVVSSGTLNSATAASPRASGPSSGWAWRTSGIPTSWWSLPWTSPIPSSRLSCRRPPLLQGCDGSSSCCCFSSRTFNSVISMILAPFFFFYFAQFCLYSMLGTKSCSKDFYILFFFFIKYK